MSKRISTLDTLLGTSSKAGDSNTQENDDEC